MMPASPPFRQKKPVLAVVIASVAVFSFLVIAGLVAYPLLAAQKTPSATPSGSALAAPSAAAVASAAVPAELKQPLFVSVEPTDGLVGLEEEPLQSGSITLNLAPSDSVRVRFEKKGYVSQVVTIEGREIDPHSPFKRIMLVKDKPVAIAPTGRGSSPGKPVTPTPPLPATATAPTPKTLTCPPGLKLDMFGKGCERPL